MLLILTSISSLTPMAAAGDTPAAPSTHLLGAADPDHVLVRLDTTGHALEGPVAARLTGEDGAVVDCGLNDDGRIPDAIAADGIWTGLAATKATRASLTVTAVGWTGASTVLSLASGGSRELDLAVSGASIVPAARSGLADGGGERAGRTPAGAGGEVVSANRGSHRRREAAAEPASNNTWYIAAAVGGLVLLGVGFFWFRHPHRAPPLPEGVVRVPDEGLFGVGTPALATGITQWVAAEADRADLVATLVQRVAERAPVLVHAPAATVLPAIRGGPAFRASHGKAAELHDAAYDLLDAHASLALLLVAPPGALTDWTRDVDADFPVLAVVGEPTPGAGAIVRCARVDGAWVITPA